jgi:lipid II:glycine glycyltransferase (peptidoglycan interpeptide bridge formation enzyme)
LKWFFVYSDRTFVCSYSADAENVNLPLFKEPAVKPSVWNRKYVSGKVVVKNSEHAKRLITKLFQMGYQWQSATCSVPSDAVIKQIRWIFLFDNGIMECIFAHELGMNTESKEYRIIKP